MKLLSFSNDETNETDIQNLQKKKKKRIKCGMCIGCCLCILLILILYFSLRPKSKSTVGKGEILTLNISDLDEDQLEFDNMEPSTSPPTISPSTSPTYAPTGQPTSTYAPTYAPTNQPTSSPTYANCPVNQTGHLTCVKNISYGRCITIGSNQWSCSCVTGAECIGNDRCNDNNQEQDCDISHCKGMSQTARSCQRITESPTLSPTTKSPTRSPTNSPTPCKGVLGIEVGQFDSFSGLARVWVHATKSTWDYEYGMSSRAFYRSSKQITNKNKMSWTLQLPVGEYAIMALDDEDKDNKMDTNFIGLPQEGVGSSNGASGGPFGGPKWTDAKFEIKCGEYKLAIIALWKP